MFTSRTKAGLCSVQYLSSNYHVIFEVFQYVNNHRSWTLTKPVNTLALQIAANVAYTVTLSNIHILFKCSYFIIL
jgi:hypothetical protein